MREILFRAKRIDNGKWVYGYLVKQFGIYKIYDDSKEKDFGEWIHEVDPVTVGQYTGLHDKNGKGIFEGDIVKWGHLIGSEESPIRIAIVEINPDIQYGRNINNCHYRG